MIQILGLREFTDKDTGEVKLYDAFFDNHWRATDIYDLFTNLERYVAKIPEDQRWNMFYTVASCTDQKRKFAKQDVLPIDIDGIKHGTEEQIVDVVLEELGLDKDKTGIVFSGNGIHLLIGLEKPFTDSSYFRTNRVYYKALCGRVNQALFMNGLSGKADTTVFSEARILRLPFTANVKKDKGNSNCKVINRNIIPVAVDVFTLADLPSVGEGEHVHPNAYARFPDPDTKAVLEGCSFIKHCGDTDKPIIEPMWYAMLSIVGRLKDGEELAFQYSKPRGTKHPKYAAMPEEMQRAWVKSKLDHALESAGPRTCENIATMWEGCAKCPHYKKITSPIQITGTDTIRTQKTGFYDVIIKDGVVKTGKPNYDDLVKFWKQKHEFISIEESQQVMLWKGTHWIETTKSVIHNFAETNFKPTPSNTMCNEFEGKLRRTNIKPMSFTRTPGKMNFNNGVLNLDTKTVEPHSRDYGFTYVIPYDYVGGQDCPTFKQFMMDITCNDKEVVQLLLEYMGAILADADPELLQVCAVLYGDGANGKSVLINLIREMLGSMNCASIGIDGLVKETNRYHLMNKIVNLTTETPTSAFLESEIFKAMVAGDVVPVRRLYGDPMEWKCTTKIIFACNNLPHTTDFSYGIKRRLLIIPFNNTFSDDKGNRDPHILKKLMTERSAIFDLCLEHYRNLVARDYNFIKPSIVKEEIDDYINISDSVGRFVVEMCIEKAGNSIDAETAYRCYVAWCTDNAIRNFAAYATFIRRFNKLVKDAFTNLKVNRINKNGIKRYSYSNVAIQAVANGI